MFEKFQKLEFGDKNVVKTERSSSSMV